MGKFENRGSWQRFWRQYTRDKWLAICKGRKRMKLRKMTDAWEISMAVLGGFFGKTWMETKLYISYGGILLTNMHMHIYNNHNDYAYSFQFRMEGFQ